MPELRQKRVNPVKQSVPSSLLHTLFCQSSEFIFSVDDTGTCQHRKNQRKSRSNLRETSNDHEITDFRTMQTKIGTLYHLFTPKSRLEVNNEK